jgi:hypothetical protein
VKSFFLLFFLFALSEKNSYVVVDPTSEEESLMTGSVTITTNAAGKASQHSFSSIFSFSESSSQENFTLYQNWAALLYLRRSYQRVLPLQLRKLPTGIGLYKMQQITLAR